MYFDTVLFDLDDTLHDRNKSLSIFIDIFIENYAHLLYDNSILILKDMFIEIDCKGYKPRGEMFKELQNRIAWKSQPDISELINFWNIEFPKCAEPMEGLYELLVYLRSKSVKMAIVTNGSSHMQNTKIDKLKIREYMSSIIISEEVGMRKPDPGIFLRALSEMNSSSKTALYVGDNPSIDVIGSMNAGLTAVWFSCGEIWNMGPCKPRHIISRLADIENLL